jgi:N-acetylmuramoyl-L-alanine amidase
MIRKKLLTLGCMLLLGSFVQESAAQVKKIKTIVVDAGHGGKDSGAQGEYENSLNSSEKDITLAISLKLIDELKKQMPDLAILPTRTTDVFDNVNEKARIANELKGDLFVCIHADAGTNRIGTRQVGTKMVTKYKVRYEGKGKNKKKITESYEVEVPIFESYKMSNPASGTSVYIFNPTKISDRLKAIKNDEYEGDFDDGDTTIQHVDYTTPEGRILANAYSKLYLAKADLVATMVLDEIAKTGRKTLGVKQRAVGIRVLSDTKMPSILIETGFISNEEDEKYLNSEAGQNELVLAIAKAIKAYRSAVEEKK